MQNNKELLECNTNNKSNRSLYYSKKNYYKMMDLVFAIVCENRKQHEDEYTQYLLNIQHKSLDKVNAPITTNIKNQQENKINVLSNNNKPVNTHQSVNIYKPVNTHQSVNNHKSIHTNNKVHTCDSQNKKK